MASLTIRDSALRQDIDDILEQHKDKYSSVFQFECKLHTAEKDLDHTDGLLLNEIYIVRDYVDNISDYIEVKLSIHLGTFIYDVYNHLDNIEVTLITTKQLYKNKKPYTVKERYKAVYLLDKNTEIPNIAYASKQDLDNQLPVVITLQLLDRSAEVLRVKTTQGNFDEVLNSNKDMSITTFLKSVISNEANKVLIENKPSLDTFDIEEPDNTDSLKSVTIPSYTRIVELPDYIQNSNIGIYNGDVGVYIQKFGKDYFEYKKGIFIYSLYNSKKFNVAPYRTIFYSPVSSAESIAGISYKYKDNILRVIPYNLTRIHNDKETSIMSTGSGFRVSNANSYMKKPVLMKESGPVFKRERLVSEISFKDREDNLNFGPNRSVRSNQFKLTSDVLRRNGSYITLEVDNLDHEFIYPGGKCKILYEGESGDVVEVYGVIHRAVITYSNISTSLPVNYNSKSVSLTSHISFEIFLNNE